MVAMRPLSPGRRVTWRSGRTASPRREGPERRRDRVDALGHREQSRHVGLADEEGHGKAAAILANSRGGRTAPARDRLSTYSHCGSNKH